MSHTHRGSTQETIELAKKFVPVFFHIIVIPNCLEYTQRARACARGAHTHTYPLFTQPAREKGFHISEFSNFF